MQEKDNYGTFLYVVYVVQSTFVPADLYIESYE